MSTFVTFQGYGVGSGQIDVDVERVTHYYSIDFNGNHGTELALDNGATIRVRAYSDEVRKQIRAALAVAPERAG